MSNNVEVKTSSIVNEYVQMPKQDQFKVPTWGLLVVLVIAFFILKTFVYIKDDKRHGK
jgi:hypothetical protein